MKKNNLFLIILSVYSFLIIICSFSESVLNYINMSLTYLFSYIINDVSKLSIILDYVILGIIYIGLGIISTLHFIEKYDKNKYIIIYSNLISLLIISTSMFINSFYGHIDILMYVVRFIYSILGFIIVYAVTLLKIKKVKN